MNFLTQKHSFAILVAFLIVVPFFVVEAITTNGFARSGFPLVLFISMWVMAALFIAALRSLRRDFRAGALRAKVGWSALKVFALIWFGVSFAHLVQDQMPCFLGASGC